MSKKLLSLLLAVVIVLTLAAPIAPVFAAETQVSSQPEKKAEGTEETSSLRMGVLSDVHISYDYVDPTYGPVSGYFNGVQPIRFEKALRFFKSQGVEAIVVAGDLQEASGTDEKSVAAQKTWMQTFVDIWFEVFPEKKGEPGYVEPIVIYGNHDTTLTSLQYWPEEFGTFSDAFVKEVNGYSFVCAHEKKETLAEPLLEQVAKYNQDKPFFFIAHCPTTVTVPGDYGYGSGYGANQWKLSVPYSNLIAFNGHTHVPNTDERSIWQGDEGNEGQFTVVNTATINYNGLSNDGMSVNGYKGNAQQTEHGMIVDVVGSDVAINRYSFNNMSLDTATNLVSGEAVKIGETWSFDACDVTDRPYAYDSRVANANAPEFAEDAAITVDSVSSTSVRVTIPAATLTPPEGFSDMIEGYVVEACAPVSGKVEATARMATSYHVDDVDYQTPTYTLTVSGLKPGTKYVLKAYAQEFFDVRSEPLTVEITTSGTRTTTRTGDVNEDGDLNNLDMELLKDIIYEDASFYTTKCDVDENGIVESKDIAALEALLNGTEVTYPESEDLMDKVNKATIATNANYGIEIQNAVVRGDSNKAVKVWSVNSAGYPTSKFYFDEPVDLSGFTHLSFDVLFENENNLSDSYRKRWLSMSFISGEQGQTAAYGSMNFDPNGSGWCTTVIPLSGLKNIDLSAVTGIAFQHNFDTYAGRYDGITEHAIYFDNFVGLYQPNNDSDMLATATVTGGETVHGAGYTKNSNEAILSTAGSVDIMFDEPLTVNDYAYFKFALRVPGKENVGVELLDANGNVLGSKATVPASYIYLFQEVSTEIFAVADDVVASGLRFTYAGDSLLLDTMTVQAAKDKDLIGTSQINPIGNGVADFDLFETNGSNNALAISGNAGAGVVGAELVFAEPIDMSKESFLRFDAKVSNAQNALKVTLYNDEGAQIASYDAVLAQSCGTYAKYEINLQKLADVSELTAVAKISFTSDFSVAPTWTEDKGGVRNIWLDNVLVCDPMGDFFSGAYSILKPTGIQDGFVCEITDTADGHDNVFHIYSDPFNGGGTTGAWPGEPSVYFAADINALNHDGYEGSYDYLEFQMKTKGVYIALYLSVYDAAGKSLGSTGEYRISYEHEWSTFRVDAADLKMSEEDFNKIARISLGFNWQHQNVNGSTELKVADIYFDNVGLRSISEDADLLDSITEIRNSDWWTGANGVFTGGGWKYQSDVTADSDQALMFYRSETSEKISYGDGKTLYLYFKEPITLNPKASIKVDVLKKNYNANGGRLALVDTNGTLYELFTFSHTTTDVVTYEKVISSISGLTESTSIKGLKMTYPMNPDATMDKTALGYVVLDNLRVEEPEPKDEDDLLYTATCNSGLNQNDFTNNSISAWKLTVPEGWSYPCFNFPEAIDVTNKTLIMDIYATGTKSFRMHFGPVNGDWSHTSAATYYGVGKWTTISLDISATWSDLTEMTSLSLGVDFAGDTTGEVALYIDNVRLVSNEPEETEPTEPETTEPETTEPETEPPKPETIEDDLIHMAVDAGSSGAVYSVSNEYTYGEKSTQSLKIDTTGSTAGDTDVYYNPHAQFGDANLPDWRNVVFSANFYFGDQTPTVSLRLVDKNWSGCYPVSFQFEDLGNGWYLGRAYTGIFQTHAATTDFSQVIRAEFTFASGVIAYMDNLTVTQITETAITDWTAMRMDSGATKGAYGYDLEHTYGDSDMSLRFQPTGAGHLVLNPESEASSHGKEFAAIPDMSSGLLSFYVYFGDQTPNVSIKLTDSSWKTGAVTKMPVTDVGDGWYRVTCDLDAYAAATSDADLTKVIRVYLYFTPGVTVYIDNMTFGEKPNCMEDQLANSPGVRRPSSAYIEDGYVIEILKEYDGYANVFHVNSDPNNGGGTTDNWPDQPAYYVGESGTQYSTDEYDYYEFTFKGTGHYSDISVEFRNANGTALGSASLRLSHKESGWMTFRISLADAGLTADEIKQVSYVRFGFNWKYQNVNNADKLEADLYWRDCGFGCNDEESTNLLDQIINIRNSDYWYGGFNNYPGCGWYFDDEGAFTFYRSTNSSGMGYAPRNMYVYFQTPVAVTSGERLSLDVVNTNFTLGSKLEIIGSDGKYYVFGNVNQKGSYNMTVCVDDLVTSDGVAFDPATVTIKGIKFYNNFNPDANIDAAAGGTLAYTGLTVLEPLPVSLEDMIGSITSLTKPTLVQEGFVCEYVEELDDGRTDLIHWVADPANNGGTTSNWPGNTKIYIPSVPSSVDTTAYDYLELETKRSGVYSDFKLTFCAADNTALGSHCFLVTKDCDWSTLRVDLATLGLTAEELKQIAYVDISVSWKLNNVNNADSQYGEMWVDNLRFTSVEDPDAKDLTERIVRTHIPNYLAYNYDTCRYDLDNGDVTIHRAPGTKAYWVYLEIYFDEAVTVNADTLVNLVMDTNNFETGSYVGLIDTNGKINGSVKPGAGKQTMAKTGANFNISSETSIVGLRFTVPVVNNQTSPNVTEPNNPGYLRLESLTITAPAQ